MTRIMTRFDPSPFYKHSLGFESIFDMLNTPVENTNYPPYNIVKTGEESYKIEVAVAGFGEKDLDINVHEGELIIKGDKESEEEENFLHQGISSRKFIRKFNLADYVEVVDATVVNGILTVSLKRELPEAAKPKSIAINFK